MSVTKICNNILIESFLIQCLVKEMINMKFGYMGVSTLDQNLDRQKKQLDEEFEIKLNLQTDVWHVDDLV